MASFDLPFLPDPDYAEFLQDNTASVHSVHFSLHCAGYPDGRPRTRNCREQELVPLLAGLRGPKKYALLNSRFHCPGSYSDTGYLDGALDTLQQLASRAGLDGIVCNDHYLLQALSDRSPALCSGLEAVPGVNRRLDSLQAIALQLEYVDATHFRRPGRIMLERSMNRDLAGLEMLCGRMRQIWPDIRIGLLANEGCLHSCPFSGAHESHIAMSHLGCGRELSGGNNRELGCSRYFLGDHAHILRSPFIRPEDVELFEPHADVIKLCGRTRGAGVMQRIARAYLQRSYRGNLLELMDSMEHIAARLYLPNEAIPADFARRVCTCSGACTQCGCCRDLAAALVRDGGPLHIKRMWT